MPRIVVSVINDLVTDQRVRKVCDTLHKQGFEIVLIGRKLKTSAPIHRDYKTYRMSLFFTKGFLFYATYTIRLFLKLLFIKKDILLANDLDTLLPNFLIAVLFRKKLVYDSHELFTEVPELIHRPHIQKVWLRIEQFIFPKLKNIITVNQVIASIYEDKYKVPVHVIRNIANRISTLNPDKNLAKKCKGNRKMLILQGSGINKDRGAEEAVAMMKYLEDTVLYIIGGGDVFSDLQKQVMQLKLQDKVHIIGRLPYDQLLAYTQIADLGLSLDKNTNLNYEYSLPNKVFDYIQCQIPLMVSNRPVVAKLVKDNEIGIVFDDFDPKAMANTVKKAFTDTQRYARWKNNLVQAAKTLNWEQESHKLIAIYTNLV